MLGTRTIPTGPTILPTLETLSSVPITSLLRIKSGKEGKRPIEQDKDKDLNKKIKTRGIR